MLLENLSPVENGGTRNGVITILKNYSFSKNISGLSSLAAQAFSLWSAPGKASVPTVSFHYLIGLCL